MFFPEINKPDKQLSLKLKKTETNLNGLGARQATYRNPIHNSKGKSTSIDSQQVKNSH